MYDMPNTVSCKPRGIKTRTRSSTCSIPSIFIPPARREQPILQNNTQVKEKKKSAKEGSRGEEKNRMRITSKVKRHVRVAKTQLILSNYSKL